MEVCTAPGGVLHFGNFCEYRTFSAHDVVLGINPAKLVAVKFSTKSFFINSIDFQYHSARSEPEEYTCDPTGPWSSCGDDEVFDETATCTAGGDPPPGDDDGVPGCTQLSCCKVCARHCVRRSLSENCFFDTRHAWTSVLKSCTNLST